MAIPGSTAIPSSLVLFPLLLWLLLSHIVVDVLWRYEEVLSLALALSFSASVLNAADLERIGTQPLIGQRESYVDYDAPMRRGSTHFSRTSEGGKLCINLIACGLFSFIDSPKIGIGLRKHFNCIKSVAFTGSSVLFSHTSSYSFCTGLTSF